MGGGKHKAHESFAVSPASTLASEGLPTLDVEDLDALGSADGLAAEHLAQADAVVASTAQSLEGAGADGYAALKDGAAQATAELEAAKAAGLPPQLAAESEQTLKHLTKEYLGSLEPAELQSLAAAEGFEHPSLVGLNTPPGGQHPLVHWLDPAYGAELPSKLAIQAKASERYAALAAGETVGGMTLAAVQAADGGTPAGSWSATPAEVVAASAALHQAVADFTPNKLASPGGDGPGDGGLGALLTAENHLATASCPELGAELETAKGAAKASVDKALAGLTGHNQRAAVAKVVAAAQAEGTVSEDEARYLTPAEQLGLLRSSTATTETAGIKELAAARGAEVVKLQGVKGMFQVYGGPGSGGPLGVSALDTPDSQQAAATCAGLAGDYFAARTQVASWAQNVAASTELTPLCGYGAWDSAQKAATLTTEFRSWVKSQKLADLRAVASTMGMAETAKASRAQLQNYIAASWDPALDKASIAAAVSTAKQPAAKKPSAPKPAPVVAPSGSSATSPAPQLPPPGAKSFAAKHLQVVAALKAHQALAADLPARPPAAEVASWSFGPAQKAHLGGAHTKSIHAGPDGGAWLFKPDKYGGGAVAHAEAAASEIFARSGVPSVPVYARDIGGKTGSVQPLVKGATTLSADPKSWSQSDVDGIVRYHVAAWAVGDHDGNPSNVLRTPSGGLCPVDQGQSFKFYGTDRLATDYHPNSAYGSVPVFHQAYGAAKGGELAKGVTIRPEAALPTIKAFEAMPDTAYRAILAPVAAKGVAAGVPWVPAMRKAAQKRLGKAQVSDGEVAEEFLRTAVERKNGLRGAFASFFTTNGFGGASKLEKVA